MNNGAVIMFVENYRRGLMGRGAKTEDMEVDQEANSSQTFHLSLRTCAQAGELRPATPCA